MSSVDRIRQWIESKGFTKSDFYQKTGLSNGYLDKVKELGADKIERIITAYPEIDLYWLITGKTQPTPKKEKTYTPRKPGNGPDVSEPPAHYGAKDENKRNAQIVGRLKDILGLLDDEAE